VEEAAVGVNLAVAVLVVWVGEGGVGLAAGVTEGVDDFFAGEVGLGL